jgi:Amt family ammonium transporter
MGGVSLLAQILGTLGGVAIALVGGLAVYGTLKKWVGIRLSEEEEYQGADLSIHKTSANPETDMTQ